MKIKAILMITGSTLATAGVAQAQVEGCTGGQPPANAVQLFDGANFGGQCIQYRMHRFPATGYGKMWEQGWNDRVRSFKVGAGVRLRLFEHGFFAGFYQFFQGDVGSMANWASSLRIESRERAPDCSNMVAGEVGVWTHADFQGDCYIMSGGGTRYLADEGFANDSVSSVRNLRDTAIMLLWDDPRVIQPVVGFPPFPPTVSDAGLRNLPTPPWFQWNYVGGDSNDEITAINL